MKAKALAIYFSFCDCRLTHMALKKIYFILFFKDCVKNRLEMSEA